MLREAPVGGVWSSFPFTQKMAKWDSAADIFSQSLRCTIVCGHRTVGRNVAACNSVGSSAPCSNPSLLYSVAWKTSKEVHSLVWPSAVRRCNRCSLCRTIGLILIPKLQFLA